MFGLRAGANPSRNQASAVAAPRAQAVQGVHDRHVDGRAKPWQVDAVEAPGHARPRGGDRLGDVGELGPARQGAHGVAGRDGMGFDAEDIEMSARRPGPAPQVDEGDDVETCAESEFGDGETRARRPGLGQPATVEEDRAGFRQTVVGGKIYIVVEGRARRIGPIPHQRRYRRRRRVIVAHHGLA
jgi:hypothetical protein